MRCCPLSLDASSLDIYGIWHMAYGISSGSAFGGCLILEP